MKLLRRQRPEAVRGKYADNHYDYAEYREESNLAEAAFAFQLRRSGITSLETSVKNNIV